MVVTVAVSVSALIAPARRAVAQDASAAPADQPYRHRVLGVFDERSGEAIEDADVTDILTTVSDSSTADEPFDLAEFHTENLAGVEYYATASLAPVEFSGTSQACGVLVLWTREK